MLDFAIDESRCIQCGECAADCPAGIISLDPFPAVTNEEACIRCQHCLAVCPTAALSILGRDPEDSQPLGEALFEPARLETLVMGRRSVRRYKEEDVPAALMDRLLDAAFHAPTGVNNLGVLATVVRDRETMARLRAEIIADLKPMKEAGAFPPGMVGTYLGHTVSAWEEHGVDVMFRGAPHLLVASSPKDAPCPVQDTHIFLTTFELLAQAHGLGTLWDGIFMMALAMLPNLAGRLGIPADHQIGYALAFGRPAVVYQRTVQRGPARVNAVK